MSFVQQEQLGSGKRFVEVFSHPWIQIGITRSKDDAHRAIKRLEFGETSRICLERRRLIPGGKVLGVPANCCKTSGSSVPCPGAAAPNCSPCHLRSHWATFGS